MQCTKCGGFITTDTPCDGCRITYEEMISSVSHDEMKRLFSQIADSIRQRKSVDIESSLLACELENSSLLVAAEIKNDMVSFTSVKTSKNRTFILAFTDINEYGKCIEGIDPVPLPFTEILQITGRGDVEGILINAEGIACEINNEYLDRFFRN